jgi:hypothetical protein
VDNEPSGKRAGSTSSVGNQGSHMEALLHNSCNCNQACNAEMDKEKQGGSGHEDLIQDQQGYLDTN